MSDLISRQAAIDALEKIDCSDGVGISSLKCDAVDDAVTAIKVLPSAQLDSLVRSSARWMSVGHKRARICSHCFKDEPYKFADHDADIYDFCPHCGARMEGE